MESVDKLREWIDGLYTPFDLNGTLKAEAHEIADQIEREHVDDKRKAVDKAHADGEKSALKQARSASDDYRRGRKDALAEIADMHMVELPKDADGVPILVGDMMERGKARGRVIALMLSEYPKKWGGELHWGVQLEGEQAPTALDAFFKHYHEPTVESVLWHLAQEARAYEGDDFDADMADLVAEYATKLQIKEERDG